MALTNWNDILNKPSGIEEAASLAEDVEELQGDVAEIALEISQLSASTLPYSLTKSTKQAIDGLKLYEKEITGTTSESGAILIMTNDDTGINYNKYSVVNIECTEVNIFAFMRGGDGAYATCFSWNSGVWNGFAEHEVTLKVRYTEKAISTT